MFVGFFHIETVEVFPSHDDVINQRDFHQLASLSDFIRQANVSLVWSADSRRMVMQQDDGCRIVKKGLAQDGPAVDGSLVKSALRDHLHTNQCIMRCQIDEPRFFVIERGEDVVQEFFCPPARGDDSITVIVWLYVQTLTETSPVFVLGLLSR